MSKEIIKDLANSDGAVASVQHLRPSSLFSLLLVVAVPLLLRLLFSDVTGYNTMVWIWFIASIFISGVGIYAYWVDMAAFTKKHNYEIAKK